MASLETSAVAAGAGVFSPVPPGLSVLTMEEKKPVLPSPAEGARGRVLVRPVKCCIVLCCVCCARSVCMCACVRVYMCARVYSPCGARPTLPPGFSALTMEEKKSVLPSPAEGARGRVLVRPVNCGVWM